MGVGGSGWGGSGCCEWRSEAFVKIIFFFFFFFGGGSGQGVGFGGGGASGWIGMEIFFWGGGRVGGGGASGWGVRVDVNGEVKFL